MLIKSGVCEEPEVCEKCGMCHGPECECVKNSGDSDKEKDKVVDTDIKSNNEAKE